MEKIKIKACVNCKHCIAHCNFGSSVELKCELETQIPFFDMDEEIGDPYEECCGRYEDADEKG